MFQINIYTLALGFQNAIEFLAKKRIEFEIYKLFWMHVKFFSTIWFGRNYQEQAHGGSAFEKGESDGDASPNVFFYYFYYRPPPERPLEHRSFWPCW